MPLDRRETDLVEKKRDFNFGFSTRRWSGVPDARSTDEVLGPSVCSAADSLHVLRTVCRDVLLYAAAFDFI